MCGEKLSPAGAARLPLGSPPRVRGKDIGFFGRFYTLRITPACAGKRLVTLHKSRLHKDHPRVCGEKPTSRLPAFFLSGSPPRVRGKVRLFLGHGVDRGITPACAGKSTAGWPTSMASRDHPRVCGEKTKKSP